MFKWEEQEGGVDSIVGDVDWGEEGKVDDGGAEVPDWGEWA